MLGITNTKKKTVFNGIGVALLLCALMALMPMAGFVDNNASEVEFVTTNDTAVENFPVLPDTKKTVEYENEPSDELIGMRDQTSKTFVQEDGKFVQYTHANPVHFMEDDGAWTEIDLNIAATANGWEVMDNSFTTQFGSEMAQGVAVQVNQFVDPIIIGINPTLMTIDESGTAPEPFMLTSSNNEVTVGGNMIRYPVAEGYALDYTVESTQLKQNLVISERPVLLPGAAWFGFSEIMQIPDGYALFLGEDMLGEEITQTQESLDIRNIETGELLAQIPVPVVFEEGAEEPYFATYFIQVSGAQVLISTVVESEWLLSEDRVFPIAIDPTIKVYSVSGGYCYKNSNRCYSNSYGQVRHSSVWGTGYVNYYTSFRRYSFTAASALLPGATVESITHHQYWNYRTGVTSANSVSASVMENCGSGTSSYGWTFPPAPSGGCSGALSPSDYTFTSTQYNSAKARKVIASTTNSAAYDTISLGSGYTPGWKTSDICTTNVTCASSTAGGYITAAQTAASSVGISFKSLLTGQTYSTGYFVAQNKNSGSDNSYIGITYSGGTDSDAPTSAFVPYDGVTSYIEGSRTFFTEFTDGSGIDTTSANKPTLNYAIDNGSFTSIGATSIGTCSTSSSSCKFSATIPTISAGEFVEYYWKFQDLNSVVNVGYDPVLTGTQTLPTPYSFTVADVLDAGDDKKLTVLTTDVHAGSYYSPKAGQFIDRQFTHFDGSDEFYFEFDVSTCGTGSNACFYTGTSTFYGSWIAQHTTVAGTGTNGMASSSQRSSRDLLRTPDGYLSISAQNGPGMNLLFLYDSGKDAYAMVGIGSSPSLTSEDKLSGGSSATPSSNSGYTKSFRITLDSDTAMIAAGESTYGGHMGNFAFGNATGGAGSNANRLCVTSSGFTYFFRSTSTFRDRCSGSYSYGSNANYVWAGWALGMGYYGRMAGTGDVTYKIGGVAPLPDTFSPDLSHSALADSHSKSRTIAITLVDAGDPPSGLNVSTTAGVGPTMTYRVTPAGSAAGSWTVGIMSPAGGATRTQCVLSECTWTADIENLVVGDSIEYYTTAQDVSTVATGINTVTTATSTFGVGDPTKMFIVEWRDMTYSNLNMLCTYQAVFYDVTNEIEFKYDDACQVQYDAATVGFMDQTKTKGQTIRRTTSTTYLNGINPHTNNYRISTGSGDGSWESFDRGMTSLVNADASDIMGNSNRQPYGIDCSRNGRTGTWGNGWAIWASKCADNIPMPEGFNFTYFGTDYNYTDANDRINIGRHGNLHFVNSGSQSLVRTMNSYWTIPSLPSSGSTYAAPGLIAPYWSYYATYYCMQSTTVDCGVYYRTVPFEGKGTDISSDITQDTIWDLEDSPIRLNPANDYLSISADLTIEPGVVVQIAGGKGISFDGACDQLTINGNDSAHVLFEALDTEWLGIAFTDSCSTGFDDRHVFSYVDFKNTSAAAIAAGSRHGSTDPSDPSSNANVGNFTMDHVTFTDVGSAFQHGSGFGTVVSMNEFAVTNASGSCFDFAKDSVVSLTEGSMLNCNKDGGTNGGAIVNVAGSTIGSLFLENTTITNSYVNLIDVDLQMVTVSNVTATATSTQTGEAFGSAAGAGGEVVLNNFNANDYATVSINAIDVVSLIAVDFGSASMNFYPGGISTSSTTGASDDNAVFDNVTAGNTILRNLQPGTFEDVNIGDLTINGNPATSAVVNINNLVAGNVVISGCGWNVIADAMTAERLSSNGCSAAGNTLTVSGSTITHTSTTESALYARYSDITLGESAVTSTTAGNNSIYLAQANTNSDIRLIAVTQDGNDCADSTGATGNCDVDVGSSSGELWYGGLATIRTYRMALVGGNLTQIFKSGHTVTTSVVDGSGSELFGVGSHVTDTLGSASVWVITGDESGNTYTDHNLRAFGPAGQNETLPTDSWYQTTNSGNFTIGSSLDLMLEPAPVDFDGAAMDCAWMDAYVDPDNGASLPTNGSTPSGHTIFEFDGTPMTLSADLTLDGCQIILKGSSLKVKSTATSSPILTLTNGGSITVTISPDTGAVGEINAISSSYGLHLNIVSGSLILDGGTIRDVAQDSTTGAALFIGDGATLDMSNGATIFGSSTSADTMATVKVVGGTVNIADSSIINNGQTGTALWVEASGGSIDNIVVKNAAVGIQSFNGAPQVDGFTSTDNSIGVDVYGGMSLPTIYRSTLLSGESTGWTTYKIDLSTYLADDYLQVGWNSIFGGGNAHPIYNYASSKYYMITDRYNIELEDNNGNAWNITSDSDDGYYPYNAQDPASGDGTHATYTEGAAGGVPSWDCNTYGYQYGPNYPSWQKGYFYQIWNLLTGGNPGYPAYYASAPDQFGFDWENIEGVSPSGSYGTNYPYQYWGYYYTSYHGGQAGTTFAPPEGYQGSYNVCLNMASGYYTLAGQGARLTMPVVDISASNLSKVSLYIDVLHNRADNYQDRLDFVARSSNTVSTLIDGAYLRESGTPLFKNGLITGAETGISVGGGFAAAHFEDITVTSPVDTGLEVTGQTSSTSEGLIVTGGNYGILIGNSASGSMDLENISLSGQTLAGVYYAKDITGSLSGDVTGSLGAAYKYGPNTNNDITFSGLSIVSNQIGVETSGSGAISMTDVTLNNVQDVVINSASSVEFIEGTVNSSTVDVTGTGKFTRMRQLDVTLTADGNNVSGATISLIDGTGAASGNGVTDEFGIAEDLTYVTETVDSNGLTTLSLVGYEVMSVAKVQYFYNNSTDNVADFRYASQGITLTDTAGNAATVPLTIQVTERVCWFSSNSAYKTVAPCAGSFSSSGTRVLNDGSGGTINEYGYNTGLTASHSNQVIMIDTPYIYLKSNVDYEFNGSTIIASGAYDYYATQRWYSSYPYGSGVYMNDASLYGVAANSEGEMYGVEIGYYGSPITNFEANNTVFSNIAKIETSNGYKSAWSSAYIWEIEDVSITNSTISHFQGYQTLNNAIAFTDICLVLGGGDGAVVSGNTFNNCGVGVMLQRSPYYNYHPASSFGADNATVSNNVFNDGGEIADIWVYTNGYSDDALISDNTINNGYAAAAAIAVYSGKHTRTTISGNTINTVTDGIYVSNALDYHLTGNTINGAGDSSYAGISIVGGYGDVDNNTLVDTDGGLIVDSASSPPAPSTSLCSIASNSYRRGPVTCSAVLVTGKSMAVNIETDSWGYEASIDILKPDGTTDSWSTYSWGNNQEYLIATYSDAGTYLLTLRDSFGDGGTDVWMVEAGVTQGYTGPTIADNSISSSTGRTAPSAVGLVFEDCSSVTINSARNTVTLSDNAMSISNCDVVDSSSVFVGQGDSLTVGIDADDASGDSLTLSGTTISGYATGVEKTSGDLMLTGDATLTGEDYAVYVDDASVVAINAAVNGGASGTGLHAVDSDDVWVYPMNASGLVGMYVENSPFRWDGGTSTANTTLQVVESQGSIENITWAASAIQIDAGSNAYVTSIGNTIDASKLIVGTTATVDEANLFSMDSTHITAAPTDEVAMLIHSTDGTRASYVSTSFQPELMIIDGSDSDWNGGNALNPSGYAMPGVMSGDGTNDMMVTYVEGDALYVGLTGEDLAASDVLIYLSVDGSGSSTGYNLGGAHTLPFQANYVLWADSDSSFALYSYGFLGWGPTTLSTASVDVVSSSSLTEISIPFSRIGGTPSQIDIVTIVQGETSANVSTVHPTQNIDAANTLQSFNEYMTVELTHDDLADGSIADEVLVYRSYKGNNTPSVAKNYDVMIKTEANCDYDWATVSNLSLATNLAINLDMARACPVIQASLVDINVTEDSGAYTFSLTNEADDVQDLESDLTWTSGDGNLVAFDNNAIVNWGQNGHTVTITPLTDQFGTLEFEFEVTDSNGLTDSQNITFEVTNVNDAPVICNVEVIDCMPIFSFDSVTDNNITVDYINVLAEGFGTHTKSLGDVSNASRSYVRDMANEQSPVRQVYDWDASVESTCIAFGVDVDATNSLIITENTSNEKGGMCTITLDLTDDGAENTDATSFTVDFSVAPVNDAPVISLQDVNSQNLLLNTAGDRATGEGEYIKMTEDDTAIDNLTWDLLPLMSDIDHNVPTDLTWTVEPTAQCTYTNYFTTVIVGTDLVFTLIPDATTNGYDWEVDNMNDNGIHQLRPSGQSFCAINLVLKDTATSPSHTPNYVDISMSDYISGQDDVIVYVTVQRVDENVADYSIDAGTGVSFNGVSKIMTGTYVPATVVINAGGDQGPYNYDHMLAVTFHTDGHSEAEFTQYYNVPAYGTTMLVNESIYITQLTTKVEVTMDVLTCLNDPCDLTVSTSERFQVDDPSSHRSSNGGSQGSVWSNPGQYGQNANQTSERRPMLEDGYWCNNRFTTLAVEIAEANSDWGQCNEFNGLNSFGAKAQNLPTVVRTIGANSVPSFAPSILVVSLTGLFVSALAFSSRRAEDEEEVTENLQDDDMAVSPVIATILMVAITVVLSGVIYVWASSLANTDVKGVPLMTFDNIDTVNGFDVEDGHWKIVVFSAENGLATQAIQVKVNYFDASGVEQFVSYNLADTNGVYGFNPANSDSFVTYFDQITSTANGDMVSTYNAGDEIYVRTHDSEGTPLESVTITLSYAPDGSTGGVLLRTWTGLSHDKN